MPFATERVPSEAVEVRAATLLGVKSAYYQDGQWFEIQDGPDALILEVVVCWELPIAAGVVT